MIKAIIIDDEALARKRMNSLLSTHVNRIDVIGEANSGQKAMDLIEEMKPDLLFLDIQLPDMSGFDILENLSYNPLIIFTTAYQDYAIRAFEKLSIDYLVKPISQTRFDMSIQKLNQFNGGVGSANFSALVQRIKEEKPKHDVTSLPIKKTDKIILIDLEDIAFLKSEDKYVSIVEGNGSKHLSEKSLTLLSERLPNFFIRVHRSFIINKNYIGEIQKYFKGTLVLTLKDKGRTRIKTGETYSKEVKRVLGI